MIQSSAEKHWDAFSFYSNHASRMNVLLGGITDGNSCQYSIRQTEETSLSRLATTTPTTESGEARTDHNDAAMNRQTRVSFEVHPSLLIAEQVLT